MIRCAADPKAVAAALPAPDPKLVQDLVALAGGDLAVALSNLSAAIGRIAGERAAVELHPVLLGGVAVQMARVACLHGMRARGRG